MEPCHRDVLIKRFKGGQGEGLTSKTFAHPVTVIAESTVLEIGEDGEVVILNDRFERSTLKVDTVVLGQAVADDSLFRDYIAAGLVATKIGDVKKVRNVRGAVTDGADRAFALGYQDLQLNANAELISNLPTGIKL
jgi:hypothetical protein